VQPTRPNLLQEGQIRLLETIGRPILVAEAGRVVYRSRILRRCLDAVPAAERRVLRSKLHELALLSRGLLHATGPTQRTRGAAVLTSAIVTKLGTYEIRGMLLLPPVTASRRAGVLVEVQPPAANRRIQSKELRARFGLSPRQSEVAYLVARGLRNREVATQLSIGVRTAEQHTSVVLRKVGVASRAALAALLMSPSR
jgi:DNA-binding CsgD family transcriptional regulator